MSDQTHKQKAELALIRGIIWSLAGGFFATVYLVFLGFLEQLGNSPWNPVASAAVAGAVVATFYSAKRVAVAGAAIGCVATITHVMFIQAMPEVWALVALNGAVGFILGWPISLFMEHRRGTIVVTVTGLVAGSVAGLAAAALVYFAPWPIGVGTLAFLMVPLTGLLFTLAVLRLFSRVRQIVPHWISVAIVSGGVAGIVGVGMWLVSVTLNHDIDPGLQAAVQSTLGGIPAAILGGGLSGALSGVLLELFGVRWLHEMCVGCNEADHRHFHTGGERQTEARTALAK